MLPTDLSHQMPLKSSFLCLHVVPLFCICFCFCGRVSLMFWDAVPEMKGSPACRAGAPSLGDMMAPKTLLWHGDPLLIQMGGRLPSLLDIGIRWLPCAFRGDGGKQPRMRKQVGGGTDCPNSKERWHFSLGHCISLERTQNRLPNTLLNIFSW